MEITTSNIVTWVGMAVGLIGVWFRNQFKVERLEEKLIESGRQIGAFWKYKDEHEKEATEMREKFNREISEIRGALLVTNEQFKQILAMLQDIKERLAELEKRQ